MSLREPTVWPFRRDPRFRAVRAATYRQLQLNHGIEAGNHLELAYQREGSLRTLDELIGQWARVVAETPLGNVNYGPVRVRLSNAHYNRYWRTGSVDDLVAAIEWAEDAIDYGGIRGVERADLHGELSVAYIHRHEHLGDPADLGRAIERAEYAIADLEGDAESSGHRFNSLAVAHWTRAGVNGGRADIEAALVAVRRAVEAGPADHAQFPGWVANLGMAYRIRYERTGDPADLRSAIEEGERALALKLDTGEAPVLQLAGVSRAYRARYERTGALDDLATALEHGEAAVAGVPADFRARDSLFSNLAIAYRRRFERTGDASDVDLSIQWGERAVDATAAGHHNLAGRQANLADTFLSRFRATGAETDLAAAIELAELALAVDHVDRAEHLSVHGAAHLARYLAGRELADLDRAVALTEEALALTPADSPGRARQLTNLAAAYRELPELPAHAATTLVEQAARLETAPPVWQVRAAWAAGDVLRAAGHAEPAAALLRQAIERLPAVAPRELGRSDAEDLLGRHHGLVSEAIAAQLTVGDVEAALTVAEQGRGVLLSAQLDTRTDLTDLAQTRPDLAEEFRELRAALNVVPADDDRATRLRAAELRRELAARWDTLLERIRAVPAHEGFLGTLPVADLRAAAGDGVVVVVNAASDRSDALVLRADGVTAVRLPDLTLADVRQHAAELTAAVTTTGWTGLLARRRVVPAVVDWLRDTVAAPIRTATGVADRLWWVPTGLLSLFPLHTVSDAVSSYAPTIRALKHARQQPAPTIRRRLTVSLAHTPGQPDLPGTISESAMLSVRHPDTVRLAEESATTEGVLAALPDAVWAHFACHAVHDSAAPSSSGLLLHDGLLPVTRIGALRLAGAELAYLSACSTAQGSWQHADEVIHLSSAFQLAGYRHVVGTLWPVDDAVASAAAHRFYELLPDTLTAGSAAATLHRVVAELRTAHPDRADLWTPFIHSGP
jgi:tetratricopeptide (TPR) repeat protein